MVIDLMKGGGYNAEGVLRSWVSDTGRLSELGVARNRLTNSNLATQRVSLVCRRFSSSKHDVGGPRGCFAFVVMN